MAKPLLSAETIYEAALSLLDSGGSDALTARNLATALRCSTRTLYQQVGKRDQLIEQLLAYHLQNLKLNFQAKSSWQQSAARWAGDLRKALLTHPNLYRLMTTAHRAPVAAYADELYKVLIRAGFEGATALRACRAFTHVSIDLTLSELHASRDAPARTPQRRVPQEFADTVRWLIAGLEAELT
ncbi:MAG: TetR/AcrR family transcriptional regulator C-terminal domain-containing protein [Pseudomonadota bacterium]